MNNERFKDLNIIKDEGCTGAAFVFEGLTHFRTAGN
jgi:hypothetical protein